MSSIDDLGPEILSSLGTLPTPPFVAMEIIRLTRDPDSSAADLAEVLNNDPVLATRVLQIANSPAYGLSREVSTVERATALLGLKAVKMMALSFSLASDVGDDAGALDLNQYWYHSLLMAVSARRWAELKAPGLSEEAFLGGLLSNLGRLVLARERQDQYEPLLAGTDASWPDESQEIEAFGYASAAVTALLLDEWGLPSIIVAASRAAYCGEPVDESVNGAAELAEVLRAGRQTESGLTSTGDPGALEELEAAASAAGIEAEEFVSDLQERLRTIADLLGVDLPDDATRQGLLDEARNRLVEVSLETAMHLETATTKNERLEESNQALETIAYNDQLTGVPNRRAFDEHLERVLAGAARRGRCVGVLLMDIDHFKSFNDTYGHAVGDDVLTVVAQTMSSITRTSEMFARYGGEEFVVVIEDSTSEQLFATGERLRKAVEETVVSTAGHGPLQVTISGGAAQIVPVTEGESTDLCKAADDALYRAKERGRNCIVVAEDR